MKKLNSIIIGAAVPLLFAAGSMRGEESTTSGDWSAATKSFEAAMANAESAQAQAEKEQADMLRAVEQAKERAMQARLQFAQAESEYPSGVTVGGGGSFGSTSGGSPLFSERLTRIISQSGGGGPGRTLVIRSGDGDPGGQAALEEDLAVMSHLLDKAIAEKVDRGNRGRTAMGISVAFGPNADPIRNLYLDGYGAVFTLKVNFPLLPPPKASEAPKEKPEASSEWDEAKRELAGRGDGYGGLRTIPPRAMRLPPSEAGEEYSEQKVAQLKDALLGSLKSATNIRNLKADDSITLCVFGGSSGGPAVYRMGSVRAVSTVPAMPQTPGPGGAVAPPSIDPSTGLPVPPPPGERVSGNWVGGAPGRGSILTIRVRKSDVDAFARGKLDLDQFRKKASIAIYAGGSDGGGPRWEF